MKTVKALLFLLLPGLLFLSSCTKSIKTEDITITSDAMEAFSGLLVGCKNEIAIEVKDVELAGPVYEVVEGDAILKPGMSGKLGIIPNAPGKLRIKIAAHIGGPEGFFELNAVDGLPMPKITMYANPKDFYEVGKKYMAGGNTLFNIDVVPDENFKKFFKSDAMYKFDGGKATLIREGAEVASVELKSGNIGSRVQISELKAQAQPGDKINIKIENFKRENYDEVLVDQELPEEYKDMTIELMTIEEMNESTEAMTY